MTGECLPSGVISLIWNCWPDCSNQIDRNILILFSWGNKFTLLIKELAVSIRLKMAIFFIFCLFTSKSFYSHFENNIDLSSVLWYGFFHSFWTRIKGCKYFMVIDYYDIPFTFYTVLRHRGAIISIHFPEVK